MNYKELKIKINDYLLSGNINCDDITISKLILNIFIYLFCYFILFFLR